MIEAYGAHAVARYMGFVQANAEACVRRAIGRLTDGAARVPMDGGGEIVVEITVDAAAGEAVLDFTGTSAQLPSNFNAPPPSSTPRRSMSSAPWWTTTSR